MLNRTWYSRFLDLGFCELINVFTLSICTLIVQFMMILCLTKFRVLISEHADWLSSCLMLDVG